MLLLLLFACKNPLKDTSVPVPCDARQIFYADADGDGSGDAAAPYVGCEAPTGYVEVAGDCNDADATVQSGCDTGADSGADTGDTADSGI